MNTFKRSLDMENSIVKIYEATEETHNGFVVVRIKSGNFEGVEYTYEKIGVEETEDKKHAKLIFNPIIVKNPNNVILDDEFFKLAGDVIIDLLEKWIEETENESEDRADNFTNPDDERRLLSQGDPIPQE